MLIELNEVCQACVGGHAFFQTSSAIQDGCVDEVFVVAVAAATTVVPVELNFP